MTEQALPEKTMIYFSKSRKTFALLGYVLVLAFGFFLLLYVAPSRDIVGKAAVLMYPISAFIVGLSGYLFYIDATGLARNLPQIVLSAEGMKTAESDFLKWEEVTAVEIIRSGKFSDYFLCYHNPKEKVMYLIQDLNIRPSRLIELMSAYRWLNVSKRNENGCEL